jgi:hypothetical protein
MALAVVTQYPRWRQFDSRKREILIDTTAQRSYIISYLSFCYLCIMLGNVNAAMSHDFADSLDRDAIP